MKFMEVAFNFKREKIITVQALYNEHDIQNSCVVSGSRQHIHMKREEVYFNVKKKEIIAEAMRNVF